MSLVYITHHNENVRDYEKVGQVQTSIRPMKYTSKHKKAVKKQINQPYITYAVDGRLLITDAGKHERRTMGCATTPLNPPKLFLRKNEGLKWKRLHDHKCPKPVGLPPIPKVSEMPPKLICEPKIKTPKGTPPSQLDAESKKLETILEKPSTPIQVHSKENVEPVNEQQMTPCQTARSKKETPSKAIDCKIEAPCRSRPAGGAEKMPQCKKLKVKKTIEKKQPKAIDPCRRINFIALNINRIKSAETKRPPPRYIDTPKGESHNLINSGLIPQHVCGRNFAKVPCYIQEHKKLMQKYKETCAVDLQSMQQCTEFMKQQGVRKMTLEERVALLEGLKANYMEQLKIFQTLSLYTDTPTKKLRKGRLEKDLDQLELDIKFIQDNMIIYIADS